MFGHLNWFITKSTVVETIWLIYVIYVIHRENQSCRDQLPVCKEKITFGR